MGGFFDGIADIKGEPVSEPIERQVDNRSGVERKQLAEDEAADNGDTERAAQFRTDASAQGKRKRAEQRGHGGHHDGAEAEQAGFVNRIEGLLPFLTLSFKGKVDHHDGVFLDDTNQQDDADEGNDAEFDVEQKEGENGANSSRRQRGKNRDGMNVAL